MAVVFVNEGEKDVLDVYAAAAAVKVGLFKNNYTPIATTVLADLTAADFSGYASAVLSYGGAATNGGGQAQKDATAVDFDHDGGGTSNTIYGWYVWNNTTGKLLKANLFASPVSMAALGNRITVTEHLLGAGTIT